MIKSLPNLYSCLGLRKEEVSSMTANAAILYKERTQPKRKMGEDQISPYGDINLRHLAIPHFKLKTAQQNINRLLQQIPLLANMFGSVKGKNNILHAGQHLNHKYFLTIDLKDFFPNIDCRTVFKMLYVNGFSYDTARIITMLSTLDGKLPQGAPSSPVIANLVIIDMINEISAFVKRFNIVFTSYLDDLCFSSNTNFKALIPGILSIIRKNYFFPSCNKIRYRTGCCEITGLLVYGNQLKIVPEMRRKAYTNLHLNEYVKRVEKFNRQIKVRKKLI